MRHADDDAPAVRSLEEMAKDVVDMVSRFDRVHADMCKQLALAGMG